jgi:hypothetical protein
MGVSGADLSISIHGSSTIKIGFRKKTGEYLPIYTQSTPARINALNNKLYDALDTFILKISQVSKVDINAAADAILQLHAVGADLMGDLFGIRKANVKKFMTSAFKDWRINQREVNRRPKIEIISSLDNYIPFEFYPLFETLKPEPIKNLDDLIMVASRFLGFSSIINRSFHPPNSGTRRLLCNGIIDNIPKLRVRLFKNHRLKGLREEERFLSTANNVDFYDQWPGKIPSSSAYMDELSQYLWYAAGTTESDNTKSKVLLDHIHYFSCHINPDSNKTNEYRMHLTFPNNSFFSLYKDVYVGITDLSERFNQMEDRDSTTTYPLIFLNACGSNRRTTSGVTSFPDLFLRNGNRGIIGTEAAIPDQYANKFAASFYKYLMQGKPIGEAIFSSKWDMLDNYNPICLLYTFYGNPDLRVTRPSDGYRTV